MCFDIDVHRLSMEELRDTLRRVSMVLSRPNIVNNLPDKGHMLRQAKEKLEKEIAFRESLEQTRRQIQKMSIRCASESRASTSHNSKVCSFDKKPERERFKPHLSLKSTASGKSESMKELHSGVKMIDLTTSMSLQKQQEERVKSEQIKSKHERLMTYMMSKDLNQDDTDSDNTLSDPNNFGNDEDSEDTDGDDELSGDEKKPKKEKQCFIRIDVQAVAVYDIDEPGPSHIKISVPKREIVKPKRKIQLIPCPSEPKIRAGTSRVEAEQSEKKSQQEGDQIVIKQESDQKPDDQQQEMDKAMPESGSDEKSGESQDAGPSKIREETNKLDKPVEKGEAENLAGPTKVKSEVGKEANPDDNKPGLP